MKKASLENDQILNSNNNTKPNNHAQRPIVMSQNNSTEALSHDPNSPTPPSSVQGGSDSPPFQDVKHLPDTKRPGVISSTSTISQRNPTPGQVYPIYQQFFRHFAFDETLSVTFFGRRTSEYKLVIFYCASVLTLGFAFLLSRWSTRFNVWATTVACPIALATHILVMNSFKQRELVPVDVIQKSESVLPLFSDIREQDDQTIPNDEEDVTSQVSVYYPANLISVKDTELRTINYRCNRFIVNPLTGHLVSTADFKLISLPTIEAALSGVRPAGMLERQRLIFGANVINVSAKTFWQLLFDEILHPFNVFQVACVTLWTFQAYYTYAVALILLTIGSCIITFLETRANIKKMQKMARFVCPMTVWRDGKWCEDVSSEELVPGDLVRLDACTTLQMPDGQLISQRLEVLPCDGVILNGDALLDESMLTGESIPVAKTSLEHEAEEFNRVCWGELPSGSQSIPTTGAPAKTSPPVTKSILFSGTRLIRARPRDGRPPIMMVHRTGFLTAKGNLVQSILFPRPNNFRFYRDLVFFIAILTSIAFVGFLVSVYNMVRLESSAFYIITRALDLFTVIVPPAIHTVMSIGTIFAMNRLKEKDRIYCISPPRINVASRIDLICFDKTGTLTEEGLDVKAVLPAGPLNGNVSFGPQCQTSEEMIEVEAFPSLIELMATCHSIQFVNDELIGDPLDLKMFEFTRWKLEEAVETSDGLAPTVVSPSFSDAPSPTSKSFDVAVIRCFDFVSQLRRMSVIVQPLDQSDAISVMVKGSPESLREICLQETIPANYNRILADYAQKGYRVLACAGRRLVKAGQDPLSWPQVHKLNRKQVECDLEFLGFIIFENKLKPETAPVIQLLGTAQIESVMSTGDNILTAICVARASGLVNQKVKYIFVPKLQDPSSHLPTSVSWECMDDESLKMDPVTWEVEDLPTQSYALACTGEVMEHIFMACGDAYAHALLQRCNIFARMSPCQKQILVEFYQKFGHTVGFCGDGANDCGALRAADVGISLSQAEASVAAPFTSKVADIRCVVSLIREGRASLVTSFCLFKYMALYSMTQFTSLIFLYSFASALGNGQFTYIDLALVLPLGLLQTLFETSDTITKKPPTAKLFSFPVLLSILGQTLIQAVAQTIAYLLTKRLPEYVPPTVSADEPNIKCLENTSIFLASTMMYVTTAMLFSQGRPYRRAWYWPFFLWCAIAVAANLVLFFITWEPAVEYFEFLPISMQHKQRLLIIGGAHAVVAGLAEFGLFPVIVSAFNSLMGHRRIKTVAANKGSNSA